MIDDNYGNKQGVMKWVSVRRKEVKAREMQRVIWDLAKAFSLPFGTLKLWNLNVDRFDLLISCD